MKRFGLLALCVMASPSPAQVTPVWDTIGMSDRTCGQWTSDKAENGWQDIVNRAWVAGVLSGYNAARGGDVTRTTNGAGAFAWMDRYCAENPLDQISAATRRLIDTLVARIKR